MRVEHSGQVQHAIMHLPVGAEGRYFLDGLRHIAFGQIVINTPDGNVLSFVGRHPGPAGCLILRDWMVLDELVAWGENGFAEAYIDGRWESPDLSTLLTFGLVNTSALENFFHGKPWQALWMRMKFMLQGNSLRGSKRKVMAHYDLGNDFYELWLDKSMTYSCGLFGGDPYRSLEDAQQAKYRRILDKIAAQPGEHILDLGCGWGGFAEAAAREGLRVTGITLSKRQAEYAQRRMQEQGLGALVAIECKDYRETEGIFDHVVSIGMFEHVGEKYWDIYFRIVRERLRAGGCALVQSIMLDNYFFEELHDCAGFLETHIFPGGMLPSEEHFYKTLKGASLECKEMFAFGEDYVSTLTEWLERFEAHRSEVLALGYDEKFLRIWRFYLANCIASFRSGRTDVVQLEIRHLSH